MKIKDRAKPKTPTVEPGVYMALCVGVIDLGEQYSEKYKNYSNKVQIVWELPTETVEVDGKQEPKQLSKEFAVATKSGCKLRSCIESWVGRKMDDEAFSEFDLFDLIGRPCQLNVLNSESGEYSNVDNVIPVPKGMPDMTSDTPTIRWDMDAWDNAVFDKLPEWVKDKIKKSTQYQKEHAPANAVQVKTGKECPI